MTDTDIEALLRSGAPIGVIAVDVSTSAMQPASQAEGRRREVAEALHAAGAGDDVAAALLGVVAQVPGAQDPVGAVAAASAGRLVQQAAPGAAPTAAQADFGPVPDLADLLRARERAVPVLAVETRAGGGTIRLFPAAGLAAAREQEVAGEDLAVHQAHAGGVAQSAHAGSAEDALAQNAKLLARRVVEAVRQDGVAAVLVTGDPRSAELLTTALPDLEGVTVSALGKDTGSAGATAGDLVGAVRVLADAVVADAHRLLVDRLSENDHRLGAVGVDAVVTALQGAAVDALLIGPGDLPGELVALDAEPWVAASEQDALGAGVLGRFPARAALIRAAVLTGAIVRFPAAGVLPGTEAAAHLRRPADDT